MRFLKYSLLIAVLTLPLALSQAQVSFGVRVGGPVYYGSAYGYGPPVCPYGYYDYSPYACAPYGFWGPEWFEDGLFIGAGPWYHYYYSHPDFYFRIYGNRFHGFDRDRGFRRFDGGRGNNNFRGGGNFQGNNNFRGGGNFQGNNNFRGSGGPGPRIDGGPARNGGSVRGGGNFQGGNRGGGNFQGGGSVRGGGNMQGGGNRGGGNFQGGGNRGGGNFQGGGNRGGGGGNRGGGGGSRGESHSHGR